MNRYVAIQVGIIKIDLVRHAEINLIMIVQRDPFSLFWKCLTDQLIFSIKKYYYELEISNAILMSQLFHMNP